MRSIMLFSGLVAGLLCAPFVSTIEAQEETVRVYGPIQNVEGTTITARNADGAMVTFEATGRIVSNQPIELNDIMVGHSVALDTTMRDGQTIVTHVHTQPWIRAPGTFATRVLNSDSTVTRHLGRITAVEPIENGIRMQFMHEGNQGEMEVDVLGTVSILYHNRVETEAALKVNMLVMANTTRGADGKLSSGFVTVEVDGVKPVQTPN